MATAISTWTGSATQAASPPDQAPTLGPNFSLKGTTPRPFIWPKISRGEFCSAKALQKRGWPLIPPIKSAPDHRGVFLSKDLK